MAEATVFVALDPNRNVYVPNIFSPNDDGVNDDFRVFTCRGVKSVNYARLYDRWGGLVYEADSLLPSCLDGVKLWDGDKRGRPMPTGVYVYMIEITFLDDVTLLYRGDVTVVR
jgi:gliding motility-associated-like protein